MVDLKNDLSVDNLFFVKKTLNNKVLECGEIRQHIGGGFFLIFAEKDCRFRIVSGDYFTDCEIEGDEEQITKIIEDESCWKK